MRVISQTCTWSALWVGAWIFTTATQPCVTSRVNSPAISFNASLMQLIPPYQPARFTTMAPPPNFIPAPPLSSSCSFAAIEPYSRTSTGKYYAMECCIDLLPGIHISQSPFWKLMFNSPSASASALQDCAPLLVEALIFIALPCYRISDTRTTLPVRRIMPRLRQRMRCRKGRSRGHVVR